VRTRKLPLPHLVGALLSQRAQSQQLMLDSFFAHLNASTALVRHASDRAFAQARARLDPAAMTALNQRLISQADAHGMLQRWQGLRVVAADASAFMPAVRACHRTRAPAHADQRLFGLYLPGAELLLHAQLYGPETCERQMLFESLHLLQANDVLVLDRGYPAAWLVAALHQRGVRFCIRCEHSGGVGFGAVQKFLRSGTSQALVQLNLPCQQDALDYGFERQAPWVRLVRSVSTNGAVRVLMTNLDAKDFPPECFGQLYHQRWRIEEAFKRLKHRLKLESVSGLSQHSAVLDIAAKVVADNLASLLCLQAQPECTDTEQPHRICNRSYCATLMHRMLPRLLLLPDSLLSTVAQVLTALQQTLLRRVPGRSQPRSSQRAKPHPYMAYKG
jgi:hypothetical protein